MCHFGCIISVLVQSVFDVIFLSIYLNSSGFVILSELFICTGSKLVVFHSCKMSKPLHLLPLFLKKVEDVFTYSVSVIKGQKKEFIHVHEFE